MKPFMICLFTVALILSGALDGFATVSYRFNLDANDVILSKNLEIDEVTFPGSHPAYLDGHWMVPTGSVRLIIPNDFCPTQLTIQPSNQITLAESMKLERFESVGKESESEQQSNAQNENNENACFPGIFGEIACSGYLFGAHVIDVIVYPVQYNPDNGELYLAQTLDIELDGETMPMERQEMWADRNTIKMDYYKIFNSIDNKEAFASCYITPSLINTANVKRESFPPQRDNINNRGHCDNSLNYLVITTESLRESFEPLVESKRERGMTAGIVCVEEILNHDIPGSFGEAGDVPEAIRNYLRYAFSYFGTRWVLIGGDNELIPARSIITLYSDRDCVTDLYYSCLDGTWNENGNAFIGDRQFVRDPREFWHDPDQLDLYPDVFVGRAPVKTVSEANTFVDKLLAYLNDFSEPDYRNKALIQASDLRYENDFKQFTWFINYFMPSTVDITELYQHAGLTKASFINALNQGYSMIYAMNHGNEYTISLGSPSEKISRTDLMELSNEDMCGLLISISCETGLFSGDCIGEAWIKSPGGGGVGFIGSSSYDNPSISAGEFIRPFQYMIKNQEYLRMGEVLAMSKLRNIAQSQLYGYYRSTYMGYNLLGDPEAYIWTDVPHEFDPSIPDHYFAGEENDDDLDILDETTLTAVPHVALGVNLDGDFSFSSYSDAEGVLEHGTLFPDSIASATIVVTAPNYIPFMTTIPVVSGDNPPTITNFELSDVTGNIENDQIDAGEVFNLDVYVYNSKTTTYSGLNCSMTTTSSDVTIQGGSTSFPTLVSQNTAKNSTQFQFTVNKNTPDSTTVPLKFNFTYGQESWDETIDFLVHSPVLDIQYIVYNDDTSPGDGDHAYDANEVFTMDIVLINTGSGATSGLTSGTLTTTDTRVSQISGTYSFSAVSGSSETGAINKCAVTLNGTQVQDDPPIEFDLEITDTFVRDWYFDPNMPILVRGDPNEVWFQQFGREGIEVMWEPSTAVGFRGYNIYSREHEQGAYTKLNTRILTGGSRFVDYTTTATTTYDYVVSYFVDHAERYWGTLSGAWFSCPPNTGFPVSIGFTEPSGLAVTDFNHDDIAEIWTGNKSGELTKVKSTVGNPASWSESIELLNEVGGTITWMSAPAVANVDGDPRKELVFSTLVSGVEDHPGYVLIFEDLGDNTLPRLEYQLGFSQAAQRPNGKPTIVDQNGDGQPEISVVTHGLSDGDNQLVVFSFDGESWDPTVIDVLSDAGYNYSDIAVGKPDGTNIWYYFGTGRDDDEEGNGRLVKGIKYDGTDEWVYPAADHLSASVSRLVAGDLNEDEEIDVVFITEDLEIHVINESATDGEGEDVSWWNYDEVTEVGSAVKLYSESSAYGFVGIAIGEINIWDGLEVVVASPDTVYVFGSDGLKLTQWARNNRLNEAYCNTPLIADIDDDDDMDIIMPNGYHQIEAWDGNTGDAIAHWPIVINDRIADYSLVDVDGDNDLELVVLTQGGLVNVYDLGSTGAVEWGQVNRDDWHSNSYGFTLPADPNPADDCHAFGLWTDDENPYVLFGNLIIDEDQTLTLDPGVELQFAADKELLVSAGGTLIAEGTSESPITFTKSGANKWEYIKFASSSLCESSLKHCNIEYADKGLYVTGNGSSTQTLTVDSCVISDCYYGVYANNSYLSLTHSTVENSDDRGVYLVSCGSGKVLLDSDTLRYNGTVGTVYDNGLTLSSSSDPEVINCVITENTGGGIYCVSSSPDLSTYETSTGARANTISQNGIGYQTGDQDGSHGAEIYLSSSSSPIINTNNIFDVYSTSNFGAMIYRSVSTSTSAAVDAKSNYWGTIGVDSTDFRWSSITPPKYFSEVFNIANESGTFIDDLTNWENAIALWSEGEFASAIEHFENAISDEILPDALNAIHYIHGCYIKTGGSLNDLRTYLLDVATESENDRVTWTATRFAANCLTETGNYQQALEEYSSMRENAPSYNDSLLAEIDYLAVCEIAGGNLDGGGSNFPERINELMEMLDKQTASETHAMPREYQLFDAFPNPFNATTYLRFALPQSSKVKLTVFDVAGRQVEVLVNEFRSAGYHTVVFRGDQHPSGTYLYRLDSGSFKETKKFTLIR